MINPVESLNSGTFVFQFEKPNTIAEQIQLLCNPIIKPPSTVIHTENGYTVVIPPQNIGGPKIEVEQLGSGYYLVKKTPAYYGAPTQQIIMTEKEFIREFNGVKSKKYQDKMDKKELVKKEPYDYFRTKSGYVIKLLNGNNVTGASTQIKALPDGRYLVTSQAYPGAPDEQKIMTENQLVSKFKGEKIEKTEEFYTQVA